MTQCLAGRLGRVGHPRVLPRSSGLSPGSILISDGNRLTCAGFNKGKECTARIMGSFAMLLLVRERSIRADVDGIHRLTSPPTMQSSCRAVDRPSGPCSAWNLSVFSRLTRRSSWSTGWPIRHTGMPSLFQVLPWSQFHSFEKGISNGEKRGLG